jgi:hypothetical protein
MKLLYIIAFSALSITVYAQENKKAPELEDQAQVVKQLREREAQAAKTAQENIPKKQTTVASDQSLEVKKQDTKVKATPSAAGSGKLLPNTASLAELKASIPNRQASNTVSKSTNHSVQGLPNTATLAEIKKTIPKN